MMQSVREHDTDSSAFVPAMWRNHSIMNYYFQMEEAAKGRPIFPSLTASDEHKLMLSIATFGVIM